MGKSEGGSCWGLLLAPVLLWDLELYFYLNEFRRLSHMQVR